MYVVYITTVGLVLNSCDLCICIDVLLTIYAKYMCCILILAHMAEHYRIEKYSERCYVVCYYNGDGDIVTHQKHDQHQPISY